MISREKIQQHSSYSWIVFAVVGLGTFMATLDSSIVNVALPTIARELKTNLNFLQWVVTTYLLTISSALPIFGNLGDRMGRKKIYVYGFLIFILGSTLCGLAHNVPFLIVSRIIQGMGAAMMMANNMGLVTAAFPSNQRGRALGSTGAIVAAGSLTGPSVGGLLISHFSWPAIFFINLPIGILGFFLGSYVLKEETQARVEGDFDFLGAVFFAGGIVSFLLGLAQGNKLGWSSVQIMLLFLTSFFFLVFFIFNEKRSKAPIIDLDLYRDPFFAASNLAGLISFILLFFLNILMPFYLDHVLGYNPAQTGLMMTPLPLALAVLAPISGRLSDKIGPIILTCSGMSIMGLALILLTQLTTHSSPLEVISKLFLFGMGSALFNSPNNSAIMGSVPRNKLGVVGGMIATYRNVGMLMGIALSVAIFGRFLNLDLQAGLPYKLAFIHGLAQTLWLGAGISVLGVISSAVRSIKWK